MAMDQTQADAEAKRRYGPSAFAFVASNGLLDIRTPTRFPGITTLLGWGRTWEEALELADIRAEWHTIDGTGARLKTAIDDTAKESDAEEIRQLKLFE